MYTEPTETQIKNKR